MVFAPSGTAGGTHALVPVAVAAPLVFLFFSLSVVFDTAGIFHPVRTREDSGGREGVSTDIDVGFEFQLAFEFVVGEVR